MAATVVVTVTRVQLGYGIGVGEAVTLASGRNGGVAVARWHGAWYLYGFNKLSSLLAPSKICVFVAYPIYT